MEGFPNNQTLTSIVAVGLDGAIGVNNELPWKLRSDLKFFQKTTNGNIVIMGRKTFESIGNCLPRRENLILSHRAALFEDHPGCHHVHSIGETLSRASEWPDKQAYIIGGALTYKQFAPFVDRYLITIVNSKFPDADAFFSTDILEDYEEWQRSDVQFDRVNEEGADEFDFQIIELRHPEPEVVRARRDQAATEFRSRDHIRDKKARRSMSFSQLRVDGRWSFA